MRDIERWRQIETLYQGALELDGAERAAFLDQTCAGDDALRAVGASLLESQADADRFLAAAAMRAAAGATGGGGDGIHFIATEYIEGETLKQRMARQPLAVREALEIAMQIAGTLDAAHTQGIVHRDIKPENIMLRPDGLVKVLDFGLAKQAETQEPASAGSPMISQMSTDPGVIMGTVSHMSPEQARGLRVDARTDLFSLGVVLYEM